MDEINRFSKLIRDLVGMCSYALFDKDGNQVPQQVVTKVGEAFERILKEVFFSVLWIFFLLPSYIYWLQYDVICDHKDYYFSYHRLRK